MTSDETPPPKSLTDTILDYLAARPDEAFRCFQIARGIERETQPVANECGRLARRGRLTRIGDPTDRTTHTLYATCVWGS